MQSGSRVIVGRGLAERLRAFKGDAGFVEVGQLEERARCPACGSGKVRRVRVVRNLQTGEEWQVGRFCAQYLIGEVRLVVSGELGS